MKPGHSPNNRMSLNGMRGFVINTGASPSWNILSDCRSLYWQSCTPIDYQCVANNPAGCIGTEELNRLCHLFRCDQPSEGRAFGQVRKTLLRVRHGSPGFSCDGAGRHDIDPDPAGSQLTRELPPQPSHPPFWGSDKRIGGTHARASWRANRHNAGIGGEARE